MRAQYCRSSTNENAGYTATRPALFVSVDGKQIKNPRTDRAGKSALYKICVMVLLYFALHKYCLTYYFSYRVTINYIPPLPLTRNIATLVYKIFLAPLQYTNIFI